MPLTATDNEALFDELAAAIDAVGPQREAMLLTRLAFLLANELGDADRVRAALRSALDAARHDFAPQS